MSDTEDDEEEVPTLVSIDADEEEEEEEEVTFFPVDKMLHKQVHSFLEVGVKKTFQWLSSRFLIFFRSISSLVHHSLAPWGWGKPGNN